MNILKNVLFLMILSISLGSTLKASTPEKAALTSFGDWSMGELEGLSLNARGDLILAPKLRRLAQDIPGPIVDAIMSENGTLFFATPAPGRIWSFDGKNKPKKILELDRPLVTRLAFSSANELIALSGPDGGVHFIPIKKPWQARFLPVKDARLLMDVAVTSFGVFVSGGGETGGLWLVKDKKKVMRKAEFEESLISLVRAWPGQRETLVLGTANDGRVFKFVNGTLTALYQSQAKEVVDVLFDGSDNLYVAFSSEMDSASKGATKRDKKSDRAKKRNKKKSAGGAEIVKITSDLITNILWQSKDNDVHDLAWLVENKTLVAGTGPYGRVFNIDATSEEGAGIWVEIPDYDDVVRLIPDGRNGFILGTSHGASIWRASTKNVESLGLFTSSVLDAEGAAVVGHVSWEPADVEGVEVSVRTGHSNNPNEGWTGFSQSIKKPQNVTVAPGRFIQVQVQVSPKGQVGQKILDTLTLSYRLLNRSPEISKMVVSLPNLQTWRTYSARDQSRGVTFNDNAHKARPDSMSPSEKKLKGKMRQAYGYRTFHVVAEDPDEDRMRYRFRLMQLNQKSRKEVESTEWSEDPFWSVDTTRLAGGLYKVEADVDDALSNGLEGAKTDSDETESFRISHQGPKLQTNSIKKKGQKIYFVVQSKGAVLTSVTCSFVGGWLPVQAKDGIVDSMEEDFEVALGNEKNLTCRFQDESGNVTQSEVWSTSF